MRSPTEIARCSLGTQLHREYFDIRPFVGYLYPVHKAIEVENKVTTVTGFDIYERGVSCRWAPSNRIRTKDSLDVAGIALYASQRKLKAAVIWTGQIDHPCYSVASIGQAI